MVAGRLAERDAVDRSPKGGRGAGPLQAGQGHLVAADRLGRLRQPVVIQACSGARAISSR